MINNLKKFIKKEGYKVEHNLVPLMLLIILLNQLQIFMILILFLIMKLEKLNKQS